MDGLLDTLRLKEGEEEFSFKKLFVPLTTSKAIYWIIFIGFIVYANMLFNNFVWDDKSFIVFNSDVQRVNIAHLFGQNTFNGASEYRPIPAIYFASLYSLFTTNVFFYHVLQILIHISNSVLQFIIFKHFFNKHISFFLALVFLVHPIQVESVSYIASSGNPLVFLFGVTALLLSLKTESAFKRLLSISTLLLLALLTKETGVLFIVSILFFKILFKKNNLVMFFTACLASISLYCFIRFIIAGVYFSHPNIVPIARLSFVERLANIPAIIFYYLKTVFFPVQLNIEQLWVVTTINFTSFYFPLVMDLFFFFLLGSLGFSIYKRRRTSFTKFLFLFVMVFDWISISFTNFSFKHDRCRSMVLFYNGRFAWVNRHRY
jgi:hypothetical protein